MPEPLAERLTVVPLRLPPRLILPLLLVVAKAKVPEAAIAVVVVRVLSVLTDKPVKVAPPEARLRAPVFTTVAVPVVFKVRLGVTVVILPILPEVEAKDIEVLPVKVPAPVIVPEPEAVIVSTVPEAAAPSAMAPLVPVASNDKAPVAVIVCDTFMLATPPAVSLGGATSAGWLGLRTAARSTTVSGITW